MTDKVYQEHAQSTKSSQPLVSRRGLMGGAVGAAALFALGGYAAHETRALPVRPPGSVDEDRFLSLCLRCDRCRSVCHTGVIVPGKLADGLLVMKTPKMDFRYGFCDFCAKCAEVCPVGAIAPFDKETAKIGLAVVTSSCIALRTGACTKCKEACPEEAIVLDPDNRPIVLADKCNGCGKCEEICPANISQSIRGHTERGIVVRPFELLKEDKTNQNAKEKVS